VRNTCVRRYAWVMIVLVSVGCGSGDMVASGTRGTNRPSGGGGASGAGGAGGSGSIDFGDGPGKVTDPTEPIMAPPPPVIDQSAQPFVRDDTATSGVAQGTIDMLKQGGASCTTTITFPYDGTVFPGALPAPYIMWAGGADAAYVSMAYDSATIVDYQFAVGPSNPGQLQIPRDAWNEITRRTNLQPLHVKLSVLSGGAVSTCELSWRIAAGNMVGALYYNTYQAPPPGVADQGAVMRLALGATAEIYKQYMGTPNLIPATGPCYSCHSVSFNGSTLVASYHDYTTKEFRVEKYDVGQALQPQASGMLDNANFGALTPDGTRILAMGNPDCTEGSDTFPRKPNNFPLVEGAAVARVLNTTDGSDTNAAGLDPANYMWMAQFSPDGDQVVFNHAKSDGNGGTDRTQLAIMKYDYASNTFSDLRVVVNAPDFAKGTRSADYLPITTLAGPVPEGVNMCTDPDAASDPNRALGAVPMGSCNGPCYPAWPFFTPDGRAVIFSLVSEPDFAQAFPGRDAPSMSDLWYVDLETLEVVRLDNANRGLKPIDDNNNYYPTVMPVAVGGYFWLFWTAVRDWGHKVAGRAEGEAPDAVRDATKKRIWAAAIKPKQDPVGEITATPTPLKDPSYPGFYVDGQSESGNVRAFAALNPCLPEGDACTSGLDCCCGYCLTDASGSTCGCEVPMCSKINEKCETAADCCPPENMDDPPLQCIGGFCGFIVVQ